MFFLLHRTAVNTAKRLADDTAEMLRHNAEYEAIKKDIEKRYNKEKENVKSCKDCKRTFG